MSNDKSLLRKELLVKRKKLFDSKAKFNFDRIFNIIKKEYKSKKVLVGGYYPIKFEINLLSFLTKINLKGITVCLPVIKKNYEMVFKKWEPNQSLCLNKYGIPEPNKRNKTLKPDIILVPLVGYDNNLNRLGYGAGYYDRALKRLSLNKKTVSIGVGFSFQENKHIPVNKNDFSLDYILNEKKIIYKKN